MKIKNTNKNNRRKLNKKRTFKKGGTLIDNLSRNTLDKEFSFDAICRNAELEKILGSDTAGKSLCERILLESMNKVSVYRLLYNTYLPDFNSQGISPEKFREIFNSRCDSRVNINNSPPMQTAYTKAEQAEHNLKNEIVNIMLDKSKIVKVLEELKAKNAELTQKDAEINTAPLTEDEVQEQENTNTTIAILDKFNSNPILVNEARKFLEGYLGSYSIQNLDQCERIKKIVRLVMIIFSIMLMVEKNPSQEAQLLPLFEIIYEGYSNMVSEYYARYPPATAIGGGRKINKKLSKKINKKLSKKYKGGNKDPYFDRYLSLPSDTVNSPGVEFMLIIEQHPKKSIGLGLLFCIPLVIYGGYKLGGQCISFVRKLAKKNKLKNYYDMERILTHTPGNIRALTYILLYLIFVFENVTSDYDQEIPMFIREPLFDLNQVPDNVLSFVKGQSNPEPLGQNLNTIIGLRKILTTLDKDGTLSFIPTSEKISSSDLYDRSSQKSYYVSTLEFFLKHINKLVDDETPQYTNSENITNFIKILNICVNKISLLCKIIKEVHFLYLGQENLKTDYITIKEENGSFKELSFDTIIKDHLIYKNKYIKEKIRSPTSIYGIFQSILEKQNQNQNQNNEPTYVNLQTVNNPSSSTSEKLFLLNAGLGFILGELIS